MSFLQATISIPAASQRKFGSVTWENLPPGPERSIWNGSKFNPIETEIHDAVHAPKISGNL
jgi:hypothetical protein